MNYFQDMLSITCFVRQVKHHSVWKWIVHGTFIDKKSMHCYRLIIVKSHLVDALPMWTVHPYGHLFPMYMLGCGMLSGLSGNRLLRKLRTILCSVARGHIQFHQCGHLAIVDTFCLALSCPHQRGSTVFTCTCTQGKSNMISLIMNDSTSFG